MTISKEERAELRRQLGDEVPDHLWPDLPDHAIALLDALDAADERIASLEAEIDKLKGRNCDDANHGLTMTHQCVACSRIENCEERIAQLESWGREDCEPLKARIAELEAADQWRPMDTAPRDGTWILVRAKKEATVPSRVDGFGDVVRFITDAPTGAFQWRARDWFGFFDDELIAWLPIPALPEGGAK